MGKVTESIRIFCDGEQKQLDNKHANYEGNIGAIAGNIVGGIAGAAASGGEPLSTYQAVKAGGAIGQGIDEGIETVTYHVKSGLNAVKKAGMCYIGSMFDDNFPTLFN